ncbi:hypothetical protein EV424DRAFT_1331516, partial [Suillus variegatus]
MTGSNSSSTRSGHSLRSKGQVNAPSTTTHCKPAAHWTLEEETTLIQYLQQHTSTTGDATSTNFKKSVFQGAVMYLKGNFPQQQGREKLWSTCQTKWANVSLILSLINQILYIMWFLWSDMDGAGITLEYESTWGSFVKSHKAAKPFKNKGFLHFEIIHQMMPCKSRG